MTYSLGRATPPSTTSVRRAAGVPGQVELVVEGLPRDPASNSYDDMAEAVDAMGIATRRYAGRAIYLVSPPGSNTKVADIEQGSGRPRMLHGLGSTIGQAIRRLENHPYIVIDHRTRERYAVANMRQAMIVAKQMARRHPGSPIHIHLPDGAPTFGRSSLVAAVDLTPRGMRVRFNQALSGLGDTLTDWACSSQDFAASWANRVNAGLDVGTQAAVLGAGIAGLLGGLLGRPLLGTAIGAAVGWGTHAIWTAPQRIA